MKIDEAMDYPQGVSQLGAVARVPNIQSAVNHLSPVSPADVAQVLLLKEILVELRGLREAIQSRRAEEGE